MLAGITADLLVVVHFMFILFALLGGVLVLKWGWAAVLHIPCALWGALIEFRGWICPLTPLEDRLRQAAGGAGYGSGFIDHYLVPLVYPEALTRGMQMGLGLTVLAANLCAYALVLYLRVKKSARFRQRDRRRSL